MPNIIRFPEMKIERLRVMFRNAPGKKCGMTEMEAWGPDTLPYTPARPPLGNLAYNADPKQAFPKASASFSDRFGGTPEKAIDGKIIYRPTPLNRWTSYESPTASDWLEVDLGESKKVGRVLLHVFSDGGGVRPPKSYVVEAWTGTEWKAVPNQTNDPAEPTGSMINTATFPSISTSKIRVVFTHHGEGNSRSGVSEIEIWER